MRRLIIIVPAVLYLGLACTSLATGREQAKEGVWTNPVVEEGRPIVVRGDIWSFYNGNGEPNRSWMLGKGREGWKSGRTHIGYDEKGDQGLSTLFTADQSPSKRYPVAYFRRIFDIPARAARTSASRSTAMTDALPM